MNRTSLIVFLFMFVSGLVQAETFVAAGGTITATPAANGMVTISTTIPGAVIADLYPGGRQALPVTVPHGQRLQLMNGQKQWLCIDPQAFCGADVRLVGLDHSCPKAHSNCVVKVK